MSTVWHFNRINVSLDEPPRPGTHITDATTEHMGIAYPKLDNQDWDDVAVELAEGHRWSARERQTLAP